MTLKCPFCQTDNLNNEEFCITCGQNLQETIEVNLKYLQSKTTLAGGKYKIIKSLGEGGFAITYKALNTQTNTIVAIKERFPEKTGSRQGQEVLWGLKGGDQRRQEAVDQFRFEAEILKQCNHQSIVKYYDFFEENNTCYIVMEFIEGKSLDEIVRNNGVLNEQQTRKYFLQLAEALKEFHSQKINHRGIDYTGILHRDIKPENIMIDHQQDRAILIDFGIARGFDENVTKTNTVMLSYPYAPIEQYIPSAKRTASADLYSLCASMYYVITGQIPPPAQERTHSLQQKKVDALEAPSQLKINISPELEEIILIGMEIDVSKRFINAEHLIKYLNGNPTPRELINARDIVKKAQGNSAELEKAVQQYKTLSGANQNNFNALIELAQILIHLNRINEAQQYAEHAFKLRSHDLTINGILGIIYCYQKQWQQAVKCLEKATNGTTKKAWIELNFVLALGKTNNWQKANNVLENALKLPEIQQDHSHLAYAKSLQAWIAINQQNWKQAIPSSRQALFHLKSSPVKNSKELQHLIYPCLTIALDNYLLGKQTQDLPNCLNEFASQLPDSAFVDAYKGWKLAMEGNNTNALSFFEQANNKNNIPEWLYLNLAILYERNGNIISAINVYEKCQQINPNNAIILWRLGTLLTQQNQWEKAFEYLDKATQINPEYAEAFHNKGWLLLNILKSGDCLANYSQNELYEQMKIAYQKAIDFYKKQQRNDEADLIAQALPLP